MEDRVLDQARSKPDTVHLLVYCGAGTSRKEAIKWLFTIRLLDVWQSMAGLGETKIHSKNNSQTKKKLL